MPIPTGSRGASGLSGSYQSTSNYSTRYTDTGSNKKQNTSNTSSRAGIPSNIPTQKPTPKPTPTPAPTPTPSKDGMPTNIPKSTPKPAPTPSKAGMPTSIPTPTPAPAPTPSKAGMPTNIPTPKTTYTPSSAGMPTNIPKTTTNTSTNTSVDSNQKSNPTQTMNQESKYAKIYTKPSETIEKKEQGKVGTSPQNKIIVTEKEPIYITTREGNRILVEQGDDKQKQSTAAKSLRVRNMLSEVEGPGSKVDNVSTRSFFTNRFLQSFSGEENQKIENQETLLYLNKKGTTLDQLTREIYGVKTNQEYIFNQPISLSSSADGMETTYEERKAELQKNDLEYNPKQINSASDYVNYVKQVKRQELQKYDYEKNPDTIRINSGRDYYAFSGKEFPKLQSVEKIESQELMQAVEEEYNTYLDKQQNGAYANEYVMNMDEFGSSRMYDRDVWEEYTQDINGDYMINSRYNLEGIVELGQMGFTFDVEGLNVRDMSLEEYANTMGPIWELSYNHRTEADLYENLKKSIAVLSASYGAMGLMATAGEVSAAGVAMFSTATDTALDSADAVVSAISGDKVGAAISVGSILLPELLEGVIKNGKGFIRNTDNLLEGLDDINIVDQDVIKIYSKENGYEVPVLKEYIEGGVETSQKLLNVGTKSDAIAAVKNLPETIQSKVKDFYRGGSNAYNKFGVEQLENSNYLVQMTKPGNVPGSYATYFKEITKAGETVITYKNTIDPLGNLVHTKIK